MKLGKQAQESEYSDKFRSLVGELHELLQRFRAIDALYVVAATDPGDSELQWIDAWANPAFYATLEDIVCCDIPVQLGFKCAKCGRVIDDPVGDLWRITRLPPEDRCQCDEQPEESGHD